MEVFHFIMYVCGLKIYFVERLMRWSRWFGNSQGGGEVWLWWPGGFGTGGGERRFGLGNVDVLVLVLGKGAGGNLEEEVEWCRWWLWLTVGVGWWV